MLIASSEEKIKLMISIRHIDRTCLQEEAFIKMIKKYSNLEHDMLIVFDRRITCLGFHFYDYTKQLHTIRISPEENKYDDNNEIKLDIVAEKHNLISTFLHELCHAHQREILKKSYLRSDYRFASKIRNSETASYYSRCELEARAYACDNILKAVALYDSYCV